LKAAELGSSDAQYELGSYLINEPDKQKEGMVWIRKASEAGNLKAQHLLELLKKEKIRKSR
jgi:TPR repeat protein